MQQYILCYRQAGPQLAHRIKPEMPLPQSPRGARGCQTWQDPRHIRSGDAFLAAYQSSAGIKEAGTRCLDAIGTQLQLHSPDAPVSTGDIYSLAA